MAFHCAVVRSTLRFIEIPKIMACLSAEPVCVLCKVENAPNVPEHGKGGLSLCCHTCFFTAYSVSHPTRNATDFKRLNIILHMLKELTVSFDLNRNC